MKPPIKLSEEDIAQVTILQEKYADITAKLGQLKIEQIMINNQVQRLAQLEQTFSEEYIAIQKEEVKFAEDITKKYGEGQINLDTKEYIPSV